MVQEIIFYIYLFACLLFSHILNPNCFKTTMSLCWPLLRRWCDLGSKQEHLYEMIYVRYVPFRTVYTQDALEVSKENEQKGGR